MTTFAQPESNTHLRSPARAVARAAWVGLALLALVLFVAGNVAELREPPLVCDRPEVECDPTALNAEDLALIEAAGLPVGLFSGVGSAFNLLSNLAYIAIAVVIFWRKSDDWLALLLSLTLLLLGAAVFSAANGVLESTQAQWRPLIGAVEGPTYLAILLLIYVFPDGRFRPRWTAPVLGFTMVGMLIVVLGWAPMLLALVLLAGYSIVAVYSLVYRYRRRSSPGQRQQMKWMGFGLMTVVFGLVYWLFTSVVFPPGQPSLARVYFLLASRPVYALVAAIFPICVAIAVFRYRLWDIDVLIRRTLVYSALTALLALVYFGSVVLLQGVIRVATGQNQSELATVVSTLAIAALFVPMQARVQAVIDRRFYRRKYDAAQTLAAFAATARDEADLDQLAARLMGVVDETIQPAQASLWLKPAGTEGELRARD